MNYLIVIRRTSTALGVNGRFQRRMVRLLLHVVYEHGLLQTAQVIGEEAQSGNTFAVFRFILGRQGNLSERVLQLELPEAFH